MIWIVLKFVLEENTCRAWKVCAEMYESREISRSDEFHFSHMSQRRRCGATCWCVRKFARYIWRCYWISSKNIWIKRLLLTLDTYLKMDEVSTLFSIQKIVLHFFVFGQISILVEIFDEYVMCFMQRDIAIIIIWVKLETNL